MSQDRGRPPSRITAGSRTGLTARIATTSTPYAAEPGPRWTRIGAGVLAGVGYAIGIGPPATAATGATGHRAGQHLARPLLFWSAMPRLQRSLLVEEGSTNHCTWRSHNLTLVLHDDEARAFFLGLLRKYKGKHGIEIHSYCLMGTHPHVMCRSVLGQRFFSAFWKVVNQVFARWSNRRTMGRGQVVMERLRSPRIQDGRHQLAVMRYGDLNPVRAGLVLSPKDWGASSYRHYAFGERDELITDAPEYLALGRTPAERRKAYVHLFAQPLGDDYRVRRRDLVHGPFIGDRDWVLGRLEASGLSPAG